MFFQVCQGQVLKPGRLSRHGAVFMYAIVDPHIFEYRIRY